MISFITGGISDEEIREGCIETENTVWKIYWYDGFGSWVKVWMGLFFLVTAGLCVWGFTGMKDPILPDISDTVRNVVKWIALVGAILSGGFTIMSFMSFRNGKKHVLAMIDELKGFLKNVLI